MCTCSTYLYKYKFHRINDAWIECGKRWSKARKTYMNWFYFIWFKGKESTYSAHPMGCLNQVDIKHHSPTWYTARTIAPLSWRLGRIWIILQNSWLDLINFQEQVKKNHSVTNNCSYLSLFKQFFLVISKFLQILGLQPRISKVFLITRTLFSLNRSEQFW